MNDNVCCRFIHQMYNWKLPPVKSSLNGCIIFNWNSDVLCFFRRITWHVQYDFENVFFSIPNLTRCRTFKLKCDPFWKVSFQNHAFKTAPKMRNVSFSRSKLNQNAIFWMETLFQKLTCPKIFNSKSNALYFSVQNLKLCKSFKSKSIAFGNFYFKIWSVRKIEFKIWENIKFLSPKSDFSLVFRVLTEWWYFLSTLITTFFREEY